MLKRRHITLLVNMVRVTRDPVAAYRGITAGRLAIRSGALQKLSEAAPFLAMIGRPRLVVEIGAGSGGMLAALCAVAADDATIISVDLEGGPFGEGASDDVLRCRANIGPDQTLYLVRGDSHHPEIRARVGTLAPRGVDVLLIDGDHTYEGVRADYALYSPLVRRGGIVALHDILPHPRDPECQVDRFWNELRERKCAIVAPGELDAGGSTWGGIGVVSPP
jgi:predicted O-methyltransferase YrrM